MGRRDAFVRKLNYRLRGMVYADDSIVLRGNRRRTNASSRAGRLRICTLSVTKSDGTAIVRNATAGRRAEAAMILGNQHDPAGHRIVLDQSMGGGRIFQRQWCGRPLAAPRRRPPCRSAISSWRRDVLTALRISSPRR